MVALGGSVGVLTGSTPVVKDAGGLPIVGGKTPILETLDTAVRLEKEERSPRTEIWQHTHGGIGSDHYQ